MSSPNPEPQPLSKSSWLVFNVPPDAISIRKIRAPDDDKIVPDSEEERIKLHADRPKASNKENIQIIEIFSSDDENISDSQSQPIVTVAAEVNNDDTSDSEYYGRQVVPSTPKQRNMQTRRIILSSESSESEKQASLPVVHRKVPAQPQTRFKPTGPVVDLTRGLSDGSAGDDEHPQDPAGDCQKPNNKGAHRFSVRQTPALEHEKLMPLYVDDEDEDEEPANVDDGSILILDEPRSARKPIRKPSPAVSSTGTAQGPSTSLRRTVAPSRGFASDSDVSDDTSLTAFRTPARSILCIATRRGGKAPRMTKKALKAAEEARHDAYAHQVFNELNEAVFKDGIPSNTVLRWNNRLLSTAGRAKWHRSGSVNTCNIELAVKILDCDERIRNTIGHEMCHLACWIISHAGDENHGRIFHGWAAKVMRARPDITITTKHTYEITYKYEWKCLECTKIYGRHSKSIDPSQCLCGACRKGKLVPLFKTIQRAPKTPKTKADSQLASAKSRDSPLNVTRASPVIDLTVESDVQIPVRVRAKPGTSRPESILLTHASDDEADVEALVLKMDTTSIRDPDVA